MLNGFFHRNAMSEQDSQSQWERQEADALDRVARLGRRPLPEAMALQQACLQMTQELCAH
jgi:hypothetical protein